MPAADPQAEPNAKARPSGRGWLLALGAALLIAIIAANDVHAIVEALLEARFAILGVLAAHLLVTLTAAEAWRVLLPRADRPGLWISFRLRLIKESINSLLPVAQVGGDVVRARLAVGPALSLKTSAASCLIDAVISLVGLALFILSGLLAASAVVTDPRLDRLALQLAIAGGLFTAGVVAAERLGALRLLDRVTARSEGVLGRLSGLGAEVAALSARKLGTVGCVLWHLAAWGLGVFETWVALHALGIEASVGEAFVLESLAQGARAIGFAVPGALGIQEGGYLLICSMLGIPPDKAVALSLIRRLRELVLGLTGLAIGRFKTPPLPLDPAEEALQAEAGRSGTPL